MSLKCVVNQYREIQLLIGKFVWSVECRSVADGARARAVRCAATRGPRRGMPGGRRGLVAPQNTFLENIIRRSSSQREYLKPPPTPLPGRCGSVARADWRRYCPQQTAASCWRTRKSSTIRSCIATRRSARWAGTTAPKWCRSRAGKTRSDWTVRDTGYISQCVWVCVRRCTWMYGELTEKEAVERVDRALDHHLADQFEILLYKKNR